MTKDELDTICDRVTQLRTAHKKQPAAEIPPSVVLLREQLRKVTDERDVVVLATLLGSEYSWFGMKQDEEELLLELVDRFPDEPLPLISLAEFLSHTDRRLSEARGVAEKAIARAREKDRFVRHAHQTLARIAKELGDFDALNRLLAFLVDFTPTPGREDVVCEDDFLKGLAPGSVNPDLEKRFRARVK
jgi:hypothetical protein